MILTSKHLAMVEALHDEGSVTAAARRLHISQPALSHGLRDLETRLRARLFVRGRRGVQITPEGERLLQASRRVLTEMGRAEEDIAQLRNGGRGVLRITTECYTCYHWIPEVLRRLHDDHPGMDVRLVPDATYRTLEALMTDEVDLAVMYCPPVDGACDVHPLLTDEMVGVSRPGHRWGSRPYLVPEDFRGETLILQAPYERSSVFRRVLAGSGIVPPRQLELRLTEAILEAVKAGIGVAILPRWAVDREVGLGTAIATQVSRHGLKREWHAVVRRERAHLPAVTRFIALVQEHGLGAGVQRPRPQKRRAIG